MIPPGIACANCMESLNWHTREGLAHTLARRTGFPHEPAVIAATIKNPVIEHERTPSACKPDVNRNSTSVVKEEGLSHQRRMNAQVRNLNVHRWSYLLLTRTPSKPLTCSFATPWRSPALSVPRDRARRP